MGADRENEPNLIDATQRLLEKDDKMTAGEDVEAQQPRSPTESELGSGKHAAEYRVPTRTKYMYLGVYFGLNLGLTLFNKAILGKVRSHLARPSKDCKGLYFYYSTPHCRRLYTS